MSLLVHRTLLRMITSTGHWNGNGLISQKWTHFPKMVFSIPLPLYTTGIQEINELGERGKFYRTTLDYPRGSMELFHA